MPGFVFAGLIALVAVSGGASSQHLVDDIRNDERLPSHGIKNWQRLPQRSEHIFSPRHSHATTVFACPDNRTEQCLWLTGGYSDNHRSFDNREENENCDVWYTRDGMSWHQVHLYGDFIQGVGNWDAKPGGLAAPWYARFGHSLDALDADIDGIADVMVLAGGNNPTPSNDVWLSTDGISWFFDGYAEWPKRAYHSTAVFQGELYVIAGTPLPNDVWAGSLVEDTTTEVGYTIQWTQKMKEAPWLPRAGSCAVTHTFNDTEAASLANVTDDMMNNTAHTSTEALFILGGLAGYGEGEDNPDKVPIRARNDIWKTSDGESWTRVLPRTDNAVHHWAGRAFHGCTSWAKKIHVLGGGYMGTDGNNEVRSLEAYTDTWWSSDGGSHWMKTNYEEGSKEEHNLYSTNEWTEITVESGRTVYRGKWGFSLETFLHHSHQDLIESCSSDANDTCGQSLYVIGGKVEGFSMVSDIFTSKHGIKCELGGVTCGNRGTCTSTGCICHSTNFTGEYCLDRRLENQKSSAFRHFGMAGFVQVAIYILLLCNQLLDLL